MRSMNRVVGTVLVAAAMTLSASAEIVAQDSQATRAAAEALARLREGIAQVRPVMPAIAGQEDPASAAYQAAREALSRRRYADAADRFEDMRAEFATSVYVGDSYYWQAFALFREGGNGNLRRAMDLLQTQAAEYSEASTRVDADALMVRIEAGLARRGDARMARRITEQASGPCDEDQEVRMAALSALLNMNADRAVPILEDVLKSRDDCSVELRRRAVFLISQKMSDNTVDILLDLAHRNPDPDSEIREQAVFWLHQVNTPEALDALESILEESDDEELQERAIFAISQRSRDERATEILQSYAMRRDVSNHLRERAIFWIGQSSAAGGAEFLIDLYPRLEDDELKERTIFGIAQAGGDRSRRWLLDRARDSSEHTDVRKNALFWAGQSGGIDAAELRGLYSTLDDVEMKEQVIFVASQRNEPEVVDFLMDLVREEQDKELRERALFWLGQSKDPRVADFLLTLIRGGGTIRR